MKNLVNSIQTKLNEVLLFVKCKMINGVHFVGVRNYENSKGEISNQTFNVGVTWQSVLKGDLEKLKNFHLGTLLEKYKDNTEIVEKAYTELLNSLIKRNASELEKEILRANNDSTINRSDAQIDAFTKLANGLKTKDGDLYIYGLCVRKTVLKKGEYPTTNSSLKTIIKNEIKKMAELRERNYKQFKLGSLETVKIQGIEI